MICKQEWLLRWQVLGSAIWQLRIAAHRNPQTLTPIP
jgi:hypothetical protein